MTATLPKLEDEPCSTPPIAIATSSGIALETLKAASSCPLLTSKRARLASVPAASSASLALPHLSACTTAAIAPAAAIAECHCFSFASRQSAVIEGIAANGSSWLGIMGAIAATRTSTPPDVTSASRASAAVNATPSPRLHRSLSRRAVASASSWLSGRLRPSTSALTTREAGEWCDACVASPGAALPGARLWRTDCIDALRADIGERADWGTASGVRSSASESSPSVSSPVSSPSSSAPSLASLDPSGFTCPRLTAVTRTGRGWVCAGGWVCARGWVFVKACPCSAARTRWPWPAVEVVAAAAATMAAW
mmetsp:Transcript_6284/g.13052  ORF Transcript_6284/g.13052 Transcript_6284/m.13052 type:complete len:310 (-) Transcript_6284:384-1313(-)